MFDLALKAKLPVIGVQTDDPANFKRVLEWFAGQITPPKKVEELPKKYGTLGDYIYYTEDEKLVTPEVYSDFQRRKLRLIVKNPDRSHPLIFDAGTLPTPEPLVRLAISELVGEEWCDEFYPALRGLSIKSVHEVILLTAARADGVTVPEIRRTRASMFGSTQGLYLEDTTYDFYVWPAELEDWLTLNKDYFHKPGIHPKLVPRALMFEGPPGVGKSMAAKAISNVFGVPLYRFDIAATLDKYIGVSEGRVAHVLGTVDREAPCVLLLDEVEKIFQQTDESGVIKRMMSQLLWWLNEHQSRVFTVMTTNDKSGIPPEMYRSGRVDKVMKIEKLKPNEAREFSKRVFKSVVGKDPAPQQMTVITKALHSIAPEVNGQPAPVAHADVAEAVYQEVKRNTWV